MINLYYGLNASYKTRYLCYIQDKKIKQYKAKQYDNKCHIASNIDIKGQLDTNYNSIEMLKDTDILSLINEDCLNDKFISVDAETTAKLITKQADILILDGVETMFTTKQLYKLFMGIEKIRHQFKEIHIATNSSVPFDLFCGDDDVLFYMCNKDFQPKLLDLEYLYDGGLYEIIRRV